MMVMSVAAVFVLGIVNLLVAADKHPRDPERASLLLTMKLRQPLKYHFVRWMERG